MPASREAICFFVNADSARQPFRNRPLLSSTRLDIDIPQCKSSGDPVMAKVSRFVILVSFMQMIDDLCFVYSVAKVATRKILECSALSVDSAMAETSRFILFVFR